MREILNPHWEDTEASQETSTTTTRPNVIQSEHGREKLSYSEDYTYEALVGSSILVAGALLVSAATIIIRDYRAKK